MSEAIVLSINVGITNGPTQLINQTLSVDAYDKVDIKVPDGSAAMNVELQPGGAGKVRFLLVTCDQYSDKLSYKVNAGTDVFLLDGPHVLTGLGAVSMLDPAPTAFIFANSSGKDTQVRILIGRKAT
jgi:hypothetical protein